MIKNLGEHLPTIAERAEYFDADRGYDDTKIIVECWDGQGIKPIIDIRNCWKVGEWIGECGVRFQRDGIVRLS